MTDQSMIAIDPGKTGAIAYYSDGAYHHENLAQTDGDLVAQIAEKLQATGAKIVIVENTKQVKPRFFRDKKTVELKQANMAAREYQNGFHAGTINGILMTYPDLSIRRVRPQEWQEWLIRGRKRPKGPALKIAVHNAVQQLFPIPITKRNADAMGILAWGLGVR